MNLQKHTKQELITKIENMESRPNKDIGIVTTPKNVGIAQILILIKSWLLKFTLIAFLIRLFQKYSIIRKVWSTITIFSVSLFGISLTDIYGIEIFKSFKDHLINYFNWVNELVFKKPYSRPEIPSTEESLRGLYSDSEKTSKWDQIDDKMNRRRIKEINDTDYNKYYIGIAAFIFTSCLVWYYWEPITGLPSTIKDWWDSFRPGSDPGNGTSGDASGNINNNSGSNQSNNPSNISNRLKELKDKLIQKSMKGDNPLDNPPQIKMDDITKPKGKGILTSPSLDDLNQKATESWRDSSPTSSESTITPDDYFKGSKELTENLASISQNWKKQYPDIIQRKMKFIENSKLNTQQNKIRLVEFLLRLKVWLIKFTIVVLIIKWFKKYTWYRKIWSVLSFISVSLFGVTLLDIYAITWFSNIVSWIQSSYLYGLFSTYIFTIENPLKRADMPSKESLRESYKSSKGIQENSRISEWFNERNKLEEESNNKYYMLLVLLILLGLGWYYWDNITPIPGHINHWFRTRRAGSDPGNGDTGRAGSGNSVPPDTPQSIILDDGTKLNDNASIILNNRIRLF